jgi:uncharacterized membrane protein YecN with MAPEG domain
MTAFATWFQPRVPVLRAIAVGAVTWPIALWACWAFWPAVDPVTTFEERLGLALQLLVAPSIVLFVICTQCMRLFDNDGAEDPFAGVESRKLQINGRVFANSLEQAALFFPILVGLALRVDPAHTRILPIAVAIWCVARVMFWIGYQVKIEWRSPGFDWTFLTTTLLLGWFLVTLF